jgi:Outer membrane protein beta-barrel domain
MTRSARSAAVLLVEVLLFSAPLHAQGTEFSVGGGVAAPLGTYDEVVKIGWQGTAGLSFHAGSIPIGIRVDGTFAQFTDETPLDIKSQLIFGTANAVYRFPSSAAARLRPYLIGGIGVYNSKASGDDAPEGSATEAGINLGAGFDMAAGGAGLFVEARWHNMFLEGDNLKFLPITLGIRFGS